MQNETFNPTVSSTFYKRSLVQRQKWVSESNQIYGCHNSDQCPLYVSLLVSDTREVQGQRQSLGVCASSCALSFGIVWDFKKCSCKSRTHFTSNTMGRGPVTELCVGPQLWEPWFVKCKQPQPPSYKDQRELWVRNHPAKLWSHQSHHKVKNKGFRDGFWLTKIPQHLGAWRKWVEEDCIFHKVLMVFAR